MKGRAMGNAVVFDVNPERPVIEVLDDGRDKHFNQMTWARFVRWYEKMGDSLVHYCGLASVPGTLLFANDLETRYYWPPGSSRNDLFRFHEAFWHATHWRIYSIPAGHTRFAKKSAERVGMEIVDGFPHILDMDKVPEADHELNVLEVMRRYAEKFPIHGLNVFMLDYENSPRGEGLRSMATGPLGARLLRAAESATIRQNVDLANTQDKRN